jgi:hypothetical protein
MRITSSAGCVCCFWHGKELSSGQKSFRSSQLELSASKAVVGLSPFNPGTARISFCMLSNLRSGKILNVLGERFEELAEDRETIHVAEIPKFLMLDEEMRRLLMLDKEEP